MPIVSSVVLIAAAWLSIPYPMSAESPPAGEETNRPDLDWPRSPFYQSAETWESPTPSQEDVERGFLLFHRSYLEVLHPLSKPRPAEIGAPIQAAAARGETEPFTAAVWSLEHLSDVRATVSPLSSQQGHRLPDSCLSVRIVDLYVETDMQNDTFQRWPLYLRPNRPLTIPAGESRRFWFEVRVPGEAEPGLYEAEVIISSGERSARLPLSVRIHPFHLRQAPQYRAMYFVMMPEVGSDYRLQEAFFRDMADHGMNSVILCSMCELHPARIDPATDTAVYDFDHPCAHEQPLSYRQVMENLVESRLCALSGRVAGNLVADRRYVVGEEEMHEQRQRDPDMHRRDLARGVRLVVEEHRRNGWPRPLFYLADEPGLESLPGLTQLGDFYRSLGVPSFLVMLARDRDEMKGPYTDAIGAHTDVWCVIANQLTPRIIQRAREMNKELWSYNGGSYGFVPLLARRFFGRFALRYGLDGITQWAIYPGREPGRDAWFVLQEDGRIVPSAAWEGVREGVDDLRYDATARHWIALARQAALTQEADEAEAVRQAFFSTMPAAYYWEWEDDFGYADYDRARQRLARQIERLVGTISR